MRPHIDALFQSFDADGSGSIEYREMNKLLRKEAVLDESLLVGEAEAIALESKNAVEKRTMDVASNKRRVGLDTNLLSGLSLAPADAGAGEAAAPAPGAGSNSHVVWDETRGAMVVEVLRRTLAQNWMRVRELFVSWDTNGDGLIQRSEFVDAMRALGLQASKEAIHQLFRHFDTDGSGEVDFWELDEKLKHRKTKPSLLTVSRHQKTLRPGRRDLASQMMDAMRRDDAAPHLPPLPLPTARGGHVRGAGPRPRPPAVNFAQGIGALPPGLACGRRERMAREQRDDLEWFQTVVLQGAMPPGRQRVAA